MKETAGFSGRQGRRYGKVLKKMGVQLANEHSVRKLSKEIVSDFVEVKEKEFFNEDGDLQSYPFGRIRNLQSYIDHLLNDHEKLDLLTWHDGGIPDDELWVMIGGITGKIP